MTAEFTPALLPVCAESTKLPRVLHDVILAMGEEKADPWAVDDEPQCVLQAHIGGDHHGLVVEMAGADSGSAWTTWAGGREPSEISIRKDCPASQPNDACCAYDGHPGAHTYELTGPWHLSKHY